MLSDLSCVNNLNARVLGIDPGTLNMGLSLGIMDVASKSYVIDYAQTISIDTLVNKTNDWLLENYNKHVAIFESVYHTTLDALHQLQPDIVICEAPYSNSKFPLSFALLSICLLAIRKAVSDFSIFIPFYTIEPSAVKKAVGVKGNDGNKDSMYKAVATHPFIRSLIDLSQLDEHAIDSIAIGYNAFMNYALE